MSRWHAEYKTPVGTPEDWEEFCDNSETLAGISLPLRVAVDALTEPRRPLPRHMQPRPGDFDGDLSKESRPQRARRRRASSPVASSAGCRPPRGGAASGTLSVRQPLSFWWKLPDWELEAIAKTLLDRASEPGFDGGIWLDAYMKSRAANWNP